MNDLGSWRTCVYDCSRVLLRVVSVHLLFYLTSGPPERQAYVFIKSASLYSRPTSAFCRRDDTSSSVPIVAGHVLSYQSALRHR